MLVSGWVWVHMPEILALERLTQDDNWSKASLRYIAQGLGRAQVQCLSNVCKVPALYAREMERY